MSKLTSMIEERLDTAENLLKAAIEQDEGEPRDFVSTVLSAHKQVVYAEKDLDRMKDSLTRIAIGALIRERLFDIQRALLKAIGG
jgi:hypothetical protein